MKCSEMENIGAVIENLSSRKLYILFTILGIVQVIFFLVGGLLAPSPSSHMEHLMRICVDRSLGQDNRWFYVRPKDGCPEELSDLGTIENPYLLATGDPRELVFVAQMPNPRNDIQLEFSRWFQWLLGLLVVQTEYSQNPQWKMGTNPELRLEVRMGYKTHDDPAHVWHELTSATVSRRLRCTIEDYHMQNGFNYQCEPIELFELGSCDYPFYLLNIRIPGGNESAHYNTEIGRLTEMSVMEIHQNGGFTKVWLTMKTVLFPIMLAGLVWYYRRVRGLPRPPVLLEKSIFCLGAAMLFIDFPIEWLSFWVRLPFMLVFSDLRQGLFYAVLLSFWLIFAGEHLIDQETKNDLSAYWKNLSSVFFGCACLLVFDACERGVHLTSPFYSIWSTSLGSNLAYLFIILAVISAIVYFIFLFCLVTRVWRTIKQRRASMNTMKRPRRLRFQAIIFRFKFLMFFTLLCAAMTVIAFALTQIGEGQLRWGDYDEYESIQYTSAVQTGVYGMWNIYTFCLLAMYAPSHKKYVESTQALNNEDDDDDQGLAATEMSSLTAFAKPAFD
ncbi:Protein wntless -like protein [Trichinella pseudospiralis]|uniref:Protein wntless-like protein n=3 Tax=Trichinella TaxID=6333 RepID=A0A0V1FIR8_TRIPS|nr:Protein wntless -like protein [Trichinella pseudospiralis]